MSCGEEKWRTCDVCLSPDICSDTRRCCYPIQTSMESVELPLWDCETKLRAKVDLAIRRDPDLLVRPGCHLYAALLTIVREIEKEYLAEIHEMAESLRDCTAPLQNGCATNEVRVCTECVADGSETTLCEPSAWLCPRCDTYVNPHVAQCPTC